MSNSTLTAEQTMTGVLALLVAIREDNLNKEGSGELRKTELVLNDAGFNTTEIGSLLGKKPDTVSKTIQRARKPKVSTAKRKAVVDAE